MRSNTNRKGDIMDIIPKDLSEYVFKNRELNGGHQVVVKFHNGFGASIIRGPYTYGGDKGLFELGVVRFNKKGDNWSLTYDTPITDDVLGFLTEEQCIDYLKQIMALEA
jgi:hypothetical protein